MKRRNVAPEMPEQEMQDWLARAAQSPRRRVPKILHQEGDEFNEVFNFIMGDSYMQPHMHPSSEKIETIEILRGQAAVLYFDDEGTVTDVTLLDRSSQDYIEVPAFTWHTYVMLSDDVVTYETMMGKYEPSTWKSFASWAPLESSPESRNYLELLKSHARSAIAG